MARWVAIVALLLGVGLTAYESFNADALNATPVHMMEGGSGWPPPTMLSH